jgi:hypothetical protein
MATISKPTYEVGDLVVVKMFPMFWDYSLEHPAYTKRELALVVGRTCNFNRFTENAYSPYRVLMCHSKTFEWVSADDMMLAY